MDDILINKNFNTIKLHNIVHYFTEKEILEFITKRKIFIYNIEYVIKDNIKYIILSCVKDNNMVSCIIKNIDNFYDSTNNISNIVNQVI